MTMPNRPIAKMMSGVISRATRANGGAMSNSASPLRNPPITDAMSVTPSALVPSPCFVIRYPSKVVTVEDGSPGVFIRTAAIDPPYTPAG